MNPFEIKSLKCVAKKTTIAAVLGALLSVGPAFAHGGDEKAAQPLDKDARKALVKKHEQIAGLHEDMAKCLKKDKSFEECHKQMDEKSAELMKDCRFKGEQCPFHSGGECGGCADGKCDMHAKGASCPHSKDGKCVHGKDGKCECPMKDGKCPHCAGEGHMHDHSHAMPATKDPGMAAAKSNAKNKKQ